MIYLILSNIVEVQRTHHGSASGSVDGNATIRLIDSVIRIHKDFYSCRLSQRQCDRPQEEQNYYDSQRTSRRQRRGERVSDPSHPVSLNVLFL